MPNSPVISRSRPAVSSARASLSITHGPAMRKNGRPSPASKLHNRIDNFLAIPALMHHRGMDKAGEQGMAVARSGGKFRVKLTGQEPGMIFQRYDFDQLIISGNPGYGQTFFR